MLGFSCAEREEKTDTITSDEEEFFAYAVCVESCTSAADCGGTFSYMDEDNYRCDEGACMYTGCNSDTECAVLGDYVCAQYENGKTCVQACSSAADCSLDFAYMDEDNYRCEQGACVYEGCNSDAECAELGDYVCHRSGGFSSCLAACESASDCAMDGLYADADNYSCGEGACVYTGCNSDTECADLGDYVCHLP